VVKNGTIAEAGTHASLWGGLAASTGSFTMRRQRTLTLAVKHGELQPKNREMFYVRWETTAARGQA